MLGVCKLRSWLVKNIKRRLRQREEYFGQKPTTRFQERITPCTVQHGVYSAQIINLNQQSENSVTVSVHVSLIAHFEHLFEK